MTKKRVSLRHQTRQLAIQALYQWQLSRLDLIEIELQFRQFNPVHRFDANYFHELLHQIPAKLTEIDEVFSVYLDRRVVDLSPVELQIIRLGTYELVYHPEIPYRVVLNEAIELAKNFGADQSYKYINGVLDKVVQKLQGSETL